MLLKLIINIILIIAVIVLVHLLISKYIYNSIVKNEKFLNSFPRTNFYEPLNGDKFVKIDIDGLTDNNVDNIRKLSATDNRSD